MRCSTASAARIVAPDQCRHLGDAGSATRRRRAPGSARSRCRDPGRRRRPRTRPRRCRRRSARAARSPPAPDRRRRRRRGRDGRPDGREPAQLLFSPSRCFEAVEPRAAATASPEAREHEPRRSRCRPVRSGRTRSSGPCLGFTMRVCMPTSRYDTAPGIGPGSRTPMRPEPRNGWADPELRHRGIL